MLECRFKTRLVGFLKRFHEVFNYVPKEETFIIPPKYIDVTRSTHTDLDVMQDKRVQNSLHWKEIFLSCPCGPVRDWQKYKATTRPDNVWPEEWTQIGKAAQKRAKQEWANQKPKLDNARRMRGFYFVDLEDEEYKENKGNARRTYGRGRAVQEENKKPDQLTAKKRSVLVQWKVMDPQGNEWNHLHLKIRKTTTVTWYARVVPVLQAMNIPDAKAAVDKEWKKLETIPWQLDTVKSKKEVALEAQRDKRTVHFATLMVICHLKNAEVEHQVLKYKRVESYLEETS